MGNFPQSEQPPQAPAWNAPHATAPALSPPTPTKGLTTPTMQTLLLKYHVDSSIGVERDTYAEILQDIANKIVEDMVNETIYDWETYTQKVAEYAQWEGEAATGWIIACCSTSAELLFETYGQRTLKQLAFDCLCEDIEEAVFVGFEIDPESPNTWKNVKLTTT